MSNTTTISQNDPNAETAWQKTVRKAKEEPAVPIGAAVTSSDVARSLLTLIQLSSLRLYVSSSCSLVLPCLALPRLVPSHFDPTPIHPPTHRSDPAGMALTTAALLAATQSMRKGNRAQFNRMLRFRVAAQAFTVIGSFQVWQSAQIKLG